MFDDRQIASSTFAERSITSTSGPGHTSEKALLIMISLNRVAIIFFSMLAESICVEILALTR